jgi:hypothetical protein
MAVTMFYTWIKILQLWNEKWNRYVCRQFHIIFSMANMSTDWQCDPPIGLQIILQGVTVMGRVRLRWYWELIYDITNERMSTRKYYRGDINKIRVKLFQSFNLLCYTTKGEKSEENETIQCQQHCQYIHFVWHPRIIPHSPMYHPNLIRWSYTPPAQLLINTTTLYHLTSQQLTPLPYHTKLHCYQLSASSEPPNVTAFR